MLLRSIAQIPSLCYSVLWMYSWNAFYTSSLRFAHTYNTNIFGFKSMRILSFTFHGRQIQILGRKSEPENFAFILENLFASSQIKKLSRTTHTPIEIVLVEEKQTKFLFFKRTERLKEREREKA